MADAFNLGFDEPDSPNVLPIPEHPFARPTLTPPPDTGKPTDADLSNFPEARTSSKGPDGDGYADEQPPLAAIPNYWSQRSNAPTPLSPPTAGAPTLRHEPEAVGSAPPGAGLSAPTPPPPPEPPLSWGDEARAFVHGVAPGFRSAWESDTGFFGSLSNAQADAIGDIVRDAKAKLGVTLEDPTYGGYQQEAIERVITREKAQSWGQFFNPMNPESFFGGGTGFMNAVKQEQLAIFDEKRAALAEKIKGDQAFDRAGENADALASIYADTPSSRLGAVYSHQANVAADQAVPTGSGRFATQAGEFVGGFPGSLRNPVNDLALMFGPGLEANLVKNYFPRAAPAVARVGAEMLEHGFQQALINMGITVATALGHQAANEQRGEQHGLWPAIHDVEDSALSGFIPGALIHGVKSIGALYPDARAWIDEFIREGQRQTMRANVERFTKEAGATPFDESTREPAEPQYPPGLADDQEATNEILKKARSYMDAVHEWERIKGYPKGWTYSDVGRNRPPPGGRAPPPPGPDAAAAAGARSEPPPEPGGGGAGAGAAPPQLEGPRMRLPPPARGEEGPPFPTPPTLSDRARNRPSPSAIDPAWIARAEADYNAMPPRMPGVPPSEHLRTYLEAVRHAENPEVMAPPEPPMSAPPAPDANFIPPDHLSDLVKDAPGANPVPHLPAGETFAHAGKPVTNGLMFPARDLRTDADTYQYKAGGDENGVTDRLMTVKKWNPLSAGNIVVHERLDGHRYVVDGHQRRGLAARIMDADPTHPPISIPGFLMKEADGWTPTDVRAEAAAKNIREGIGDSLDIARILRDQPDLWDDSLPIGRGEMKEARGLANLSDEAFRMALNGDPRRDYASYVGNMAQDRTTHLAIMNDLVKFKPNTQNEARMIIADAMEAGFNSNKAAQNQTSIFDDGGILGEAPVTQTLRGERAQVYAAAERLLRDDKKIFSMLNDEAPRIVEAGNILADTNAERADRAGQLMQGLITLVQRRGPLSAALNRAAQRVADGEKPKTAARDFLNELPGLLQQEGLRVGGAADVRPAIYNLDDPKQRDEQIRDLEAEFMAAQPGFFAEPSKPIDEQRTAIHADIRQKLLDAGEPEARAEAEAALFTSRYVTRAARLGRADPEQMYREAGVVVRGDAQREAEVAGAAAPGRTLNQTATVPTFYSAVERAVIGAKQAKATPDQWIAMLKNMPGVKPEEMKWLGLEDWLREQKGSVTRDAVADYVRANSLQLQEVTRGRELADAQNARLTELNNFYSRVADKRDEAERAGRIDDAVRMNKMIDDIFAEIARAENEPALEPKYRDYKLGGGENYRELLLKLPKGQGHSDAALRINRQLIDKYGDLSDAFAQWTDAERDEFNRLHAAASEESARMGEDYKSSHWSEPNIVAHIRFDDRTIDGKRALHLAEVQSDWGQALRKSAALRKISEPQSVWELGKNFFGGKLASSIPLDQVDGGVLAFTHHNQVARDIVSLLPVDVMDQFGGKERASKQIAGDSAVLFNSLPADRAPVVAKIVLDAARKIFAEARAKLSLGLEAGGDVEVLPTLRASQLAPREIVSMLAPESLYHLGLTRNTIGANIALSGAKEPGFSGATEWDGERLPATDTEFLNRPLTADGGAIPRTGHSARFHNEPVPASIAEALDWHNSVLRKSGVLEIPEYRATGLPSMPFEKNWAELSIKRMIRHAAENGYDALTWDTGKTSADRYSLEKRISRITLHDNSSGGIGDAQLEGPFRSGQLEAFDHDNKTVIEKHISSAEHLAEVIGKEAAEKLLNVEPKAVRYAGLGLRERKLEGMDLRVGGEGMRGFYDKILPTTVAKLTKKFGGKVASAHVEVPPEADSFLMPDDQAEAEHRGKLNEIDKSILSVVRREFKTSAGANSQERADLKVQIEALRRERDDLFNQMIEETKARMPPQTVEVHSLAITPELRDAAVNEGFPLFQESAGDKRGSITLRNNGAVIDLFKKRDASTVAHEAGHLWLKELAEDAAAPNSPKQIKDDFQTVLDWLGAKDEASITDAQHEKFADGYVQWLREGKAPSAGLARAFAMFRDWLRSIYRTIRGLGKKIPDEIRAVFERLHATDEEIAGQRAAEPETAPETAQIAPTPPAAELPAASPKLEDVRAAREVADGVARDGALRAWAKAEAGGARKPSQAKFLDGFRGAVQGETRPTGKWAGVGHDAGAAFAKTKAGKVAVAAAAKAREMEAAYEAKPEAAKIVDEAITAAKMSTDPLDRQIGGLIEEEIKPLVDEATEPAPSVAEAGPEGTQQTLMPGVAAVTDADRLRLAAGAPLRGGNREMAAGGLFDEVARAQNDFFDMTPTEDGLKSRADIETKAPMETALAKFVGDCEAI